MIAIILTIIFPGLGQIYYGKTTRGIIMIILTFVPFLYPIILVWSIIDCIKLRKEQKVDPITRKEAITAIVIFFLVIPGMLFLIFFGTFTAIDFVSDNYLKPRQTKNEMTEIMYVIEKYKTENNKFPDSINDLIGHRPLRKTWLYDSWQNPYELRILEENNCILISSGNDGIFETKDDIKLRLLTKAHK